MAKMKYSEADMADLISQVENEFAEHLAKAEAKVEEIEVTESKNEKDVEELNKSEEVVKSESDECDYDDEDVADMDSMYASMTKAEAEMHFESLNKALFGENTEDKSKELNKSEDLEEEEVDLQSDDNGQVDLLKSEVDGLREENESLKSQMQKSEESFKKLTDIVAKFIKGSKAPKQRAITKIEYVARSKDEDVLNKNESDSTDVSKLSKSEISRRLSEKIRGGKLEKSEREKIDQYYLEDQDINLIKHLL